MSLPTHRIVSFAALTLGVLGLAACSPAPATAVTSTLDYAASNTLAIAAPTDADLAAGVRWGACIVQDGERGRVVYAWLARVPPGPDVTATRAVECNSDGKRASVAESVTMGAHAISIQAAVEPGADADHQEVVRIADAATDPRNGRLFLVDLRQSAAPRQIVVDLPPVSLGPIGTDGGARARTYVRDLLPHLRKDPQVQAFLTGK